MGCADHHSGYIRGIGKCEFQVRIDKLPEEDALLECEAEVISPEGESIRTGSSGR